MHDIVMYTLQFRYWFTQNHEMLHIYMAVMGLDEIHGAIIY